MTKSGEALNRFAAAWETDRPRDAMRAACRWLLGRTGQLEGPVGLEPLARALGSQISTRDSAIDGGLTAYGDEYVIEVSTAGSWRRRRFTAAHEIGHVLFFEALGTGHVHIDPGEMDEVESLCNLAAAELLMPHEDFRRAALAQGFAPAGLWQLRHRFGVSWSALLVRFLDLFPGSGASLWRANVRPGDGSKLRVVSSFGRPGPSWLARGMSDGYLSLPLPRYAFEDGAAGAVGITPLKSSTGVELVGLASRLPERHEQNGEQRLLGEDPQSMPDAVVAVLLLPTAAESAWRELVRGAILDAGSGVTKEDATIRQLVLAC